MSGFKIIIPTLAAYPNPSSRSQMAAIHPRPYKLKASAYIFQDEANNRSYGYPFHTEQITDEGAFR